jgi:essential nuclear protein 1
LTISGQEIDPNDLDIFHKFIPRGDDDPIFNPQQAGDENGGGTSLADLILEKIAAHEAAQGDQPQVIGGGAEEDAVEIPMKALDVFQKYVNVGPFGNIR